MPSKSSASKFKSQKPSLKRPRDPSPDEPGQLSDFEEGSSQDGISDDEEDDDIDSDDADAPRIAQWEADDDTIYNYIEDKPQKQSHQLSDLESNLRGLPLGALRKAQRALASVEPETESESESEPDTDTDHASESDGDSAPQEQKRVEWISRDTKKYTRANKHAPMEVTSKKPVSRKRTVVEVPKLAPRDPRFLPMAGEFKPELFRTSYGFLADSRKGELKLLRENLARARKLLTTSPAHLRTEREQEVERLEKAVKRIESLVNKDRLDSIEQHALKKAMSEENDKQKQGKGKWFLKDSEKRRIVQKARFEALSAEGGHRAVKKAIERKQKKIGQKEKKFRPYAKGAGLESSGSQRRAVYSRSFGQGPSKKQRFS